MNYYKIDVPGRNGYSFMVCSTDYLDEYEVLDKCIEKGYFEEDSDARYAILDDLVTPMDIENFEKSDCIFNLD